MDLKKIIREVPDFPKEGINFYDITTMLQDEDGLSESIEQMYALVADMDIDVVAGAESRGFIFGVPLALKLGVGFVPIRKKGKLPWKKKSESYDLEYGSNTVEIHSDACKEGDKVLFVDDLLATGGTAAASVRLLEKLGAEVAAALFLIELEALSGRDKLKNVDCLSVIKY